MIGLWRSGSQLCTEERISGVSVVNCREQD